MKVSVTIPTYNNIGSFKRTLESVLVQKYEDYEIIITDDSANDEIRDYVKDLHNEKIKYFKNQTSLGAPENWNEGIRRARGEYVKILHHDDWLADENSLEKFVKLMDENPDADFGYAKSVDFEIETGKKKGRKAQKYVKRLQRDPFELFLTNRVGAPSVAIFRNGKDLYFDKNLTWVVDMDFYIMCLLKNPKIAFINEVLVIIGLSNEQITKKCQDNLKIKIFEHFYLYNKYKNYLKDGKYARRLVKIIKVAKIKDLDALKEILNNNIEIPENVVKYCSKRKLCLKNLFHFS